MLLCTVLVELLIVLAINLPNANLANKTAWVPLRGGREIIHRRLNGIEVSHISQWISSSALFRNHVRTSTCSPLLVLAYITKLPSIGIHVSLASGVHHLLVMISKIFLGKHWLETPSLRPSIHFRVVLLLKSVRASTLPLGTWNLGL